MGITRELGVFLGDMLGGAAHLHIRTVRFIRTRQRIGPATVATPMRLFCPGLIRVFLGWLGFEGWLLAMPWRLQKGSNVPLVATGTPEGARASRQVFRSRIPALPAQST